MITLKHLGLQRGSKVLLQDANLTLFEGQKVGVIGANGCGKSTLFKLMTGALTADQGDCVIPSQWTVSYMAQEITHSDRSALDYVLDGDAQLRSVQQRIAQLGDDKGEELGNLYAELETIDGYTAEPRAHELLHGLGFSADDPNRPVSDFSGGWQIRLNLARALMCPADLMLLDEPTNHLDLDTTWWLEKRLQQFQGTLLIISHDRDFLDNTVSHIVHLEHQHLNLYSGGYTAFERQRAEKLAQQQHLYEKQQSQIADIERFVARFRAKASKAKQAQSRLKSLQRLETIAPAHVDSPFSFRIPCSDKVSQPLLQLRQANLGYKDATVLANVNLRIEAGARLGLLGPNGAGKSTLVKSLMGDLPLISGDRISGEHLTIGYFNQHQLEALDLNASAALHIQRLSPKASEQQIRNYLGSFDFHGDRALESIEHFSGGEKARLALALIAWSKPNLLLLDEPTNHLDLEMREALTFALQQYEGAMVIISHDRHLLRNSVDEFVLVAEGKAAEFDGDLDSYHKWLQNRDVSPSVNTPIEDSSAADKKAKRQQAAAIREQLQPLKKQVNAAEKRLDKAQSKLDDAKQQLHDESLYAPERKADLQALLKQQGELTSQVEAIEEEWLSLSEAYEALEQELSDAS